MNPSYDKILQLLNDGNPHHIAFTKDNVILMEPTENIGAAWNTKLNIKAMPDGPFAGMVDIYYHRIQLSSIGTDLWLFSDQQFDHDNIVNILNTTKNTFLAASDIDTTIIPLMRIGDIMTVVITANPNSYGWTGSNEATLIMGFPSVVNKLHTLLNYTLPGNDYIN